MFTSVELLICMENSGCYKYSAKLRLLSKHTVTLLAFDNKFKMQQRILIFVILCLGAMLYIFQARLYAINRPQPEDRMYRSDESSKYCSYANCSGDDPSTRKCDFTGVDNSQGIGFDEYIVPNIVHYIRFNKPQYSYFEFVCLKSAYYNINPDYIYIHTDNTNITGEHWEEIRAMPHLYNKIRIIPTEVPTTVFNQTLSDGWRLYHASDVVRIQLMMKYGGIYLDDDVYVIKNLHKYRRYEMAVGWESTYMGSQILIGHKDARFLKLWWESYRNYRSDLWYYNAGEYPSHEIIEQQPELAHVVFELFNSKFYELWDKLYRRNWTEWTNFEAIHLALAHRNSDDELTKKYPVLTKDNIVKFNKTVTDMALAMYYRTDVSTAKPPMCLCCMYSPSLGSTIAGPRS